MTVDEKKKWLRSYKWACLELERLYAHRRQCQAQFERLTATLTGMPRGSGLSYADILAEMDGYDRLIIKEVLRVGKIKKSIKTAINGVLDDMERLVLEYRYLDLLKWDEICFKIPCSWNTVHRWHRNALDNINI